MNQAKDISISIVSHGHDLFLPTLLMQIAEFSDSIKEVIITHNIANTYTPECSYYGFEIQIVENPTPLGFAENHNQAFSLAKGEYFCVLNPDIILKKDPFKELLQCFDSEKVGLVAPLVVNLFNEIEDSARYFPTPLSLLKKAFGLGNGMIDISKSDGVVYPDWVAGMFLLTPCTLFRQLGGFDPKFWLYYEDVDLCLRFWKHGYHVALCSQVVVIHVAQRESHRDFLFLKWHASSAIRFFWKHLFRFPETKLSADSCI
jgi:hypothetical protein